jgi:hypothetical protein
VVGVADVADVTDAGVDALVRGVGVDVLGLPVPGGALLHAPTPRATAANAATEPSRRRRRCVIVTLITVRDRRRGSRLSVIVEVSG